MYIFSEYMDKLKDKMLAELKPGSIIISNTFQFKELEPTMIIDKYFIYKIK
jgi:hypothetical protein